MVEAPTVQTGSKGLASRFKLLGSLAVVLTIIGAVALATLNISAKEKEMEGELARHQEIVAAGRVDVVSTWLASLAQQADRLISSDLFRLFASEVDLMNGDLTALLAPEQLPLENGQEQESEAIQLAAQLPMMRNLLGEFVSYSGFLGGRIVNRQGQAYIATDASTAPMTALQGEYARQVLETANPAFSALRRGINGLVLDIFLPIFPPQFEGDGNKPVGVLMLSRGVSNKLNELVTQKVSGSGSHTLLVQKSGDEFQSVLPWLPEGLRTLHTWDGSITERLSFSVRPAFSGEGNAYSMALKVPALDWWVVEEASYASARVELGKYRVTVIFISILVATIIIVFIGLLWWILVGIESRKVADEYKHMAQQIADQKGFLDSINNTITDFIGLKDTEGLYRYVNPAFANAVGRAPEEMIGLDDAAIFGFETARRLKNSDDIVRMGDKAITVDEIIFLQSRKFYVQVLKAPFNGSSHENGIVSVFRDVTSAVEAQERNKRVVHQTVAALVRTIENTDPYLGGHTRMMEMLALELARSMKLTEEETATVEAAANLSQVGKMFVPKEIIHKPGKLTEEEKHVMEQHVEHSREVLQDIDFDLPVMEAIYQMNERLDGSGYPLGLKGDQISMVGKVLGLINTFCAIVRPRAYRPAVPVTEALEMIRGLTNQYDHRLVSQLEEIMQTPVGDRIREDIGTSN